MENQVKTKATILDYIKNTMKVVFDSKEDVINNIDEISDWEQCKKEMNSNKFTEEERQQIQTIIKLEQGLNKRKQQAKNSIKSLEKQIKYPEKRTNMKVKNHEHEKEINKEEKEK